MKVKLSNISFYYLYKLAKFTHTAFLLAFYQAFYFLFLFYSSQLIALIDILILLGYLSFVACGRQPNNFVVYLVEFE